MSIRRARFAAISLLVTVVASTLLLGLTLHAQSGVGPDIARLLAQIKGTDKVQLSVSEEDGRFLRLMIVSSGAKRALEIGGAEGYSAIWIGLGLRATGGHMTSIEFDPVRAKSAAEHIRAAGLSDVVTIVPGDAFQAIPKL